jgi:hypothetical protein
MTRRAVVTLAAVALGAGVLVSSVATATGPCNKKVCSEEIAAGCAGLKGMALSACSKAVLLNCNTTDCSCTDPTLPACGPTTTTTSTTTTSTSTSTTTTMLPVGAFLDFTTGSGGGAFCGNTLDASNAVIKNLTCGGLNIGGGASLVPEGPIPDGSISRFALSCTGRSCTIGPTSSAPPVNTAGPDCTDTGCNFGTPLPIPIPVTGVTTCVLNIWSAPASGTLDLCGGTSMNVALNSDIYLTGNLAQPCPRCSATGTPSSPGTGICDRGPRAGMACTTTRSTGLTRDCPTGGADATHPCTPGGGACIDGLHAGVIGIDLSPLTTGTASITDPGGLFCPGQGAGQVGRFGSPACRTLSERGVSAGPFFTGVPTSGTLASVFCIGATGNGLVDASANLPGPGAVSLPGTFLANTTTTTLPPAVCGNGVVELGEQCDGQVFCTSDCRIVPLYACCDIAVSGDGVCSRNFYPEPGPPFCLESGAVTHLGTSAPGGPICPGVGDPYTYTEGACGDVTTFPPTTFCCDIPGFCSQSEPLSDSAALVSWLLFSCEYPPFSGIHPAVVGTCEPGLCGGVGLGGCHPG